MFYRLFPSYHGEFHLLSKIDAGVLTVEVDFDSH